MMLTTLTDTTLAGLYFAAVCLGIYLIVHLWRKVTPDLGNVMSTTFASVGAVVSSTLGVHAFDKNLGCTGPLQDQRLGIFLGALALFWLAASEIARNFRNIWG